MIKREFQAYHHSISMLWSCQHEHPDCYRDLDYNNAPVTPHARTIQSHDAGLPTLARFYKLLLVNALLLAHPYNQSLFINHRLSAFFLHRRPEESHSSTLCPGLLSLCFFVLFWSMDGMASRRYKEEEAGSKQHYPTVQISQQEATVMTQDRSPTEEFRIKLAAIALSLNVRLRSSDMPVDMQERALRYARSFLDKSPSSAAPKPRPNLTLLARALKKVSLLSISKHSIYIYVRLSSSLIVLQYQRI
jgi:hypothetical protein